MAATGYKIFRNIITLDQTDSTNNYIRRQAGEYDPQMRSGVVLVARDQSAGRGRKERSWQSGRNMSLTFSFLLDISSKEAADISGITLAAGVAVQRAMRHFGLRCRVKWPNDIYVGHRKLCGILSETVVIGGSLCAICGIGININLDNQALMSIGAPATSIYAETAVKHDPMEVLPKVLESLDKWIGIWLTDDIARITSKWMKSAYGLGRGIRIVEADSIIDEGFFVGLGKKGQFMLRRLDGNIREIWAGDVIWDKP
jgi:BirA family biotin operon repressor/biotin-[acetyl-CoA-carboxylase] ligase